MRNTTLTLLAICFLLSCNKDTTELEVPPFSAFPNPFVDQLAIYFDTNRFPNSNTVIYVLDGKGNVVISFDFNTAANFAIFQMSNYDKGIYYVEMELEGKMYNLPILKAE